MVLEEKAACALESAALTNPDHEIYLLVAAPARFAGTNDLNDRLIRALHHYTNVKFARVDVDRYFSGTPVDALFHSGLIESSTYFTVHLSDVMRFVTMWRFGALYFDLDVVTMRSLGHLAPNFAGLENTDRLAAGAIRFAHGTGRHWVELCLEMLNLTYDPRAWAENANGLLTRCVEAGCNTSIRNIDVRTCPEFTAYASPVFYPLPWKLWPMFFERSYVREVLVLLTKATAVHLYHTSTNLQRLNHAEVFGENRSALDHIFRRYCPRVHAELMLN